MSGKLTAEQVSKCARIVYLEGYSDGSVNRGAHIDETDWQAIADELNAMLGIDDKSRWAELFGTPERAARMLAKASTCNLEGCADCESREMCDFIKDNAFKYKDGFESAMLEWLRGDAE